MFRPFDSGKMFDDARNLASGTPLNVGTVAATNTIDMGTAAGDEVSPAEIVCVVESPTSASGNTGTIQLRLSDSADNSSFTVIQTGKVSTANAGDMNGSGGAAGRMFVPPNHRRYLKLEYVVATANFTAGTLHAGVV